MADDLAICEHCTYYQVVSSTIGQCRFNTPYIMHVETWEPDAVTGSWPVIRAQDWCAKWKRKPAAGGE